MNIWKNNLYSVFRKQQEEYVSNYFAEKRKLGNGFYVQEKFPYILKEPKDWDKNIILDPVLQYIKSTKAEARENRDAFPLHKYLHHGLSSQAMLFNLFGDPILKKDYSFFQEVFHFNDIQIDDRYLLKFEYCNRSTFNENQQQPTSFDFAILDKTKEFKSIFVEAKYVETEFGKCSTIESGECDGLNPVNSPELCFLTHKERNYWELMKKYKLDIAYTHSPICPFVIYYQFYRELMFALENNGYYVILVDKRNPAFEKFSSIEKRGLIPLLLNQIPSDLKTQIKVIYIQDVLVELEKFGYEWVGDFRKKYGINKK